MLINGSNFMKFNTCTCNLHIIVQHHLDAQEQSHKFLVAPFLTGAAADLCRLRQTQARCVILPPGLTLD